MSDGGAWGLLVAVAGAATPFVIYACRVRALRHKVAADRAITPGERGALRRRGRISVFSFVGFWILSIGLILTAALLGAPPAVHRLVLAVIGVMAFAAVWLHLRTRCPICHYRLGYQRSLSVPARCERCGADLS